MKHVFVILLDSCVSFSYLTISAHASFPVSGDPKKTAMSDKAQVELKEPDFEMQSFGGSCLAGIPQVIYD